MTQKPRLHVKTADKCNNSHWDMCCENKYLDFRIHAELFFTKLLIFSTATELVASSLCFRISSLSCTNST